MLIKPPKQSECHEVFGDFLSPSWDAESLVRCDLSFAREAFGHVKGFSRPEWFGFMCHKLVAPKFLAAFKKIVERKLADKIVSFDGCLNKRKIANSETWSMHSWAIAMDLNAATNPYGQKTFDMSTEVVACFEEEGFIWGGRWQYPDAMHFQYAVP